MEIYNVLQRAILSEKSNFQREEGNKYTFVVHPDACKSDIKKALKKAFDVDVEKVNVSIRRGKLKRRGMHVGKQSNIKKAVVSLVKGQKISVFEDN